MADTRLLALRAHPEDVPWPTDSWSCAPPDPRVDGRELDRLLDYAYSETDPEDLEHTHGVVVVQGGSGDGLYGYNCPAVQNAHLDPWRALPTDQAPKRFGFYSVEPVDLESRNNRYVNAVFLDYGRGDNPWFDPSARLRDYLVQVDAHDPDLFLGKAYIAVAGARAPSPGFCVLERRHR